MKHTCLPKEDHRPDCASQVNKVQRVIV